MRRTLIVALFGLVTASLAACEASDPSAVYFDAAKPTATPLAVAPRPSVLPSLPPLSSAVRAPLPNAALTPGVVATKDTPTVCAMDKRATAAIDPSDATTVFDEYGITSPTEQAKYKIDLLIPTQLGGADTVKNMWPMQVEGAGYYEKQQLNIWLWSQVCRNSTPLDQAQSLITQNWFALWLESQQ